jgi:nucleotide-binding universal stress UspA family protein
MNQEENADRIKRILVALDASPQSLAALETAAQLAADLQAELVGLFVEDINVIRTAEFHFAREIGYFSATVRRIDRRTIRWQIRGQAERAERAMRRVAERYQLEWSFRVSRGSIASELQSAAQEADLIILGRTGWSGGKRIGSTVLEMISRPPGNALILQQDIPREPSVLVLYDGSEPAKQALRAAARISRASEGFLVVGVIAENSQQARERQRWAARWLGERGVQTRFRWIIDEQRGKIQRIIKSEQCLLVMANEMPSLKQEDLPELLDQLDCSVLLVQ